MPQSHQPRQGVGSRAGRREAKGGRNGGGKPEGGVLGFSRGQEALPTQGSLMQPAGTSQRSAALLACSLHASWAQRVSVCAPSRVDPPPRLLATWIPALGPILCDHSIKPEVRETPSTIRHHQHRADEGPRGPERTRDILEVTQPMNRTDT